MKFLLLVLFGTFFSVSSSFSSGCAEDWTACRQQITLSVFGTTSLPNRSPDSIEHVTNYRMEGLPSPGTGSGVGNVTWANNMTKLVWNMTSKFVSGLSLNSTVFHTLSTSYRAPANYPPPPYPQSESYGPYQPTETNTPYGVHPIAPQEYSETVLLYQNGHETFSCVPNYDGVVDYFNRLGYDVMELMMPLIGCNQAYQYGNPQKHAWFEQFEKQGDHTLRYFIEPVALTVAYAKSLGYRNIVLVGLSGGGWTTTLASAIIPDIRLSIPVAGSIPKWPTQFYDDWVPDLPEGRNNRARPGNPFEPPPVVGAGGDYEQNQSRPTYAVAGGIGFMELYVLGAYEQDRYQLQILHEYDSCCFRAAGLEQNISKYNSVVQSQVNGWMATAVTKGNFHEINLRDKVLIAFMIELFQANDGKLEKEQFDSLPFDLLAQKISKSKATLL